MRILKKTLPICCFLLHSSTTHKSFSSSLTPYTSMLFSKLKTLLQSKTPHISQDPTTKSPIPNEFHLSNDPKIATLSIPISQNPTPLPQSDVLATLLGLKTRPLAALKYFYEAKNQPWFDGGVQSFCVLFHILANSDFKGVREKVRGLVSCQKCPYDAAIFIQGLTESAKRFKFCVSSRVFCSLLNGFVDAGRIDYAIVCFDAMIENFGTELKGSFAYYLLRTLIEKDRFDEVEELLNKIVLKELRGNVKTVNMLMEFFVRERKYEKAEKLFRKARDMKFNLGPKTYSCAVGAVCKKVDMNAACELLMEMISKGWVPSDSTFRTVIKACVRQRNLAEAMRVNDEMVLCEHPKDLVVATSLMKGYCELGDMECALSLLKKSIEDGFSPERLPFLVLFRGYCNKGDMEGANELCNLMTGMGIKSNVFITFLLIKGFLDVQSWEKACEQLKLAVNSGVIDSSSFNFLMAWLCAEGKVDEAWQLWDKIVETGSIRALLSDYNVDHSKGKNVGLSDDMVGKGFEPNAVTYTILMDGHFKKGKVEKALNVFDEMVSQRIVCKAYTYNTIIQGLCFNGLTSQARKMLEKFTEGGKFKPSFTTYNFILDGFIKEDNKDSALSVYTEMSEKGIPADVMLSKTIVDKCNDNKLDCALKMLNEMVYKGFELDVSAYEPLISGLCRRGSMKSALNLYSGLLYRGLPPSQNILNCMITGFKKFEGNSPQKKIIEGKNNLEAKAVAPLEGKEKDGEQD